MVVTVQVAMAIVVMVGRWLDTITNLTSGRNGRGLPTQVSRRGIPYDRANATNTNTNTPTKAP